MDIGLINLYREIQYSYLYKNCKYSKYKNSFIKI